MKVPGRDMAGFTLIEALMAMSVLAIGLMMIVPSIFAWVNANAVSTQRDQAAAILDRAADTLAQQGWATAEWNNQVATRSSLATAVGSDLDDPPESDYSNWVAYTHSQVPYGAATTIDYATVGVTNSLNQLVTRVMKVRIQWQGPAGNTLQETRLLQRSDAP